MEQGDIMHWVVTVLSLSAASPTGLLCYTGIRRYAYAAFCNSMSNLDATLGSTE